VNTVMNLRVLASRTKNTICSTGLSVCILYPNFVNIKPELSKLFRSYFRMLLKVSPPPAEIMRFKFVI
jgi:hypothetical protein